LSPGGLNWRPTTGRKSSAFFQLAKYKRQGKKKKGEKGDAVRIEL